jgi:hypothetical protein
MDAQQPAPARGVLACVVDRDPRFSAEARRWFAVLTDSAGVQPRDLTVHCIGQPSAELLRLARCGVRLTPVAPFDRRVPTCNKISGALALARRPLAGDDVVVLSDTDLAMVEDPRRLAVPADAVGGRAVDGPNPGLAVLAGVFAAAGLELPPVVPAGAQAGAVTVAGNFNGGLYVLRGSLVPRVASAWAACARWLLERDRLGPHRYFTDQVALALALRREGIRPWPLPGRWNYPVHVRHWISPAAVPPAAIHYHRRVTPSGQLCLTGVPAVDGAIGRANEAIRACRSREEVLPCPGTCS